MGQYRLTAPARRDLQEIVGTIAQNDPATAIAQHQRIVRTLELLASQPEMGSGRYQAALGARMKVVDPWLVFYRVDPFGVMVLRIIHGARHIRKAFLDRLQ